MAATRRDDAFVLVLGAGHDDAELLDGSQMINEIKGFLASTDMT
jgi:hypothetical protein